MNVPAQKKIPTHVKNDGLVAKRRRELVEAAVRLFAEKGYHPTTTREIARAVGWSTGAVYEYVKGKEDILYLVCDAIHSEMEAALEAAPLNGATGRERLEQAIADYLRICDRMQDSILLIYQETGSLAPDSRRYVLKNEKRVARHFKAILKKGREDGSLRLDSPRAIELTANTIMVIGHMWAFRRWTLSRNFVLEDYITGQTALILRGLDSTQEPEAP